MAPLIPTSSSCHSLKLPPVESDDRLNLNVRTGSCSTLSKSILLVHGGLSIGIEIYNYSIVELESILNLKLSSSANKNFETYLSGEFFYLNLIEREWFRIQPVSQFRPKPRVFHEIVAFRNRVYLFGGLALSTKNQNKFKACNDLWEFNLESNQWLLINDGHSNISPSKRFCHKMGFLNNLSIIGEPNHVGILIMGGKDKYSNQIHDNYIYDLNDSQYVNLDKLKLFEQDPQSQSMNITEPSEVSLNFKSNTILTYNDENSKENSLIIFSSSNKKSPLVQFDLSEANPEVLKGGRLSIKIANSSSSPTTYEKIPYYLNYPNGGKFGQNIVLVGFLPNDYDISIFIYHKPTAKWSRLKIFCNHEFGAHRFWGGFVWNSHHKVVLIGNYITSRTSSNIRYFTQMVTVALPITNVLASREFINKENEYPEFAKERRQKEKEKQRNNVSFADYAHYAAPKTKFSSIRSVFPPAAVTLGRNAFERYGTLMSDFEFISADGEKIPVPMLLLRKRWGRVFDMILAKSYVRAIDTFKQDQMEYSLGDSKETNLSDKLTLPPLFKSTTKEAPHFRLPFQDKENSEKENSFDKNSVSSSPLPPSQSRKSSIVSNSSISTNSDQPLQLPQNLTDLPPQLPLPNEPIPEVPQSLPPMASQNSQTQQLQQQRKPYSNSSSPLPSPRASIVGSTKFQSPIKFKNFENLDSENSSLRRSSQSSLDDKEDIRKLVHQISISSEKSEKSASFSKSLQPHIFNNSILNFDYNDDSFKLESLLIPRKLYFPFSTSTVRAFIEYLYTGQVGNKWTIAPVTLDVLLMAKFYEVPLLYDLILEVLYGIIGRKESFVIEEFKNLQFKYILLIKKTKSEYRNTNALDEFKGFMETVEDGYLDSFILQKANRLSRKHHPKRTVENSEEKKISSDEDGIELIAFVESSMPEENASGNDFEGLKSDDKLMDHIEQNNSHSRESSVRSSKSENEKLKLSNVPTLEQLSSSESSAPSDIIIDFIYEAAVLANDMKLMLRSSNVREMTKIYNSEKDELVKEIERMEKINEKMNPNIDKPRRNKTSVDLGDDKDMKEIGKTYTDLDAKGKKHLHNLHNLPIFSHRKEKK